MEKDKPQNPWVMLGCAWLLAFAMFGRLLCLPPIGHLITEKILLSHSQLGLIFSLPVGMLAVVAVPGGFLADRYGIRKAGGFGAAVMAVGSLLTSTAGGFWDLLGGTCLFGIGFSLVYPNLPKLVGVWFPREKAGVVTGIYATGIGTGAALALTITLRTVFPLVKSFQGVFFIWSLPAVLAAILWWMLVRDPSVSSQHKPQYDQETNQTHSSGSVWKNKGLWLVVFAFFCNNVHFYTWSGWTPKLMMLKGASPNSAALISSLMQWVSLPAIFLVPWFSYKLGLRKPFVWMAATIMALASWAVIYAPVSWSWPIMVVVGIALTGTFPILISLPVEMVPKASIGKASGLVLSVGYIGGLVGPLMAGYSMDVTHSLDLALVVLVGVGIIWALLGFLLPETGSRPGPQE
ncbi:MAG: MFS transporter [Desulfobacteraceae bacterium]|nr:MFS transporter [Desulfobacteraceae bacterium]